MTAPRMILWGWIRDTICLSKPTECTARARSCGRQSATLSALAHPLTTAHAGEGAEPHGHGTWGPQTRTVPLEFLET